MSEFTGSLTMFILGDTFSELGTEQWVLLGKLPGAERNLKVNMLLLLSLLSSSIDSVQHYCFSLWMTYEEWLVSLNADLFGLNSCAVAFSSLSNEGTPVIHFTSSQQHSGTAGRNVQIISENNSTHYYSGKLFQTLIQMCQIHLIVYQILTKNLSPYGKMSIHWAILSICTYGIFYYSFTIIPMSTITMSDLCSAGKNTMFLQMECSSNHHLTLAEPLLAKQG